MNYQQTLAYLYAKLPMFTRVGVSAFNKNLDNTIKFCTHLHHPEKKFKSIHVGGTNGKGSSSHMLAAILQEAGYKTGLYTSPHLKDFRERIKINGEMISEGEVISFVKENQDFIEELSPSFFEATVAMAFQHFAKHEVDIAIIEVGLGGRLDSTNIIEPELAVITNISYDHMNLLGNTLAEIAAEKAGIIKSNIPVVIGQYQEEIATVFIRQAKEKQAYLYFASKEYEIIESKVINQERSLKIKHQEKEINISLDLTGTYQQDNVKTVLCAIAQINKKGFAVSDQHISSALSQVKKLTGLMGRWQILSTSPLTICDTGHNEDGIKAVLENIELTEFNKLHFVIGMVKDKDIGKILSLLPKQASYYFCAPQIERAKPAEELQAEAAEVGLQGNTFRSIKSALETAQKEANADDLIFIGGSTFVVAEVV